MQSLMVAAARSNEHEETMTAKVDRAAITRQRSWMGRNGLPRWPRQGARDGERLRHSRGLAADRRPQLGLLRPTSVPKLIDKP